MKAADFSSGHKDIASYAETIRTAIELATQIEDANTADIFTQVLRSADMNLWFVEAHEQAEHRSPAAMKPSILTIRC